MTTTIPHDRYTTMHATSAELDRILGSGWVICRATLANRERFDRCITRKQYRAAVARALKERGPVKAF